MEQNMFLQETRDLKALLNEERAKAAEESHRAYHMWQELENTKEKLQRQKNLKEIFIKKNKEIKLEYERLQKYAKEETLSTAKIASQVQCTIKRRKKKLLQIDYEELKVAHVTTEQRLSSELQMEKNRNTELQGQLMQVQISYEDLSRKSQADAAFLHHQSPTSPQALESQQNPTGAANTQHEFEVLRQFYQDRETNLKSELDNTKRSLFQLQNDKGMDLMSLKWKCESIMKELDKEVQARLESDAKHQEQIVFLKAENEALRQKMAKEISAQQSSYSQCEKGWISELEQVKIQLADQKMVHNQLLEQLKDKEEPQAQKEVSESEEPDREMDFIPELLTPDYLMREDIDLDLIPETSSSLDSAVSADASGQTSKKIQRSPSIWKKTRHFLGLKKSHKRRKSK